MSKGAPGVRYAEVERESPGLRVSVVLDLDGGNHRDIATGFPFLDALLHEWARCGRLNLGIQVVSEARGMDYVVLSEVGLALGTAYRQCVEDSAAVVGYASEQTPYRDALVQIALEHSETLHFSFEVALDPGAVQGLHPASVRALLHSFGSAAGLSIHVRSLAGDSSVPVITATFRGVGSCLFASGAPLLKSPSK